MNRVSSKENILSVLDAEAHREVNLEVWNNSLDLMDDEIINKIFSLFCIDKKYINLFNDNLNRKVESLQSGDMEEWKQALEDDWKLIIQFK